MIDVHHDDLVPAVIELKMVVYARALRPLLDDGVDLLEHVLLTDDVKLTDDLARIELARLEHLAPP